MKEGDRRGVASEKILALRQRAEERLQGKVEGLKEITVEEVQQLIQELQIHQVELEMQNEELLITQAQLEESRNKYSDLYDFAPVGYFTFDKNGLILEVNLTGADQLGVERKFLVQKPFLLYVAREHQEVVRAHRLKVFGERTPQTCEVRLINKRRGVPFYARLDSVLVRDPEGREVCRTAVIDITERKRVEEERDRLLAQEQAIRAEAEAARQRLAFLAEASRLLAASLDYQTRLENLASLVVPHVADWCAVDMMEGDQSFRRLALACVDLSGEDLARERQSSYTLDARAPYGISKVLCTGQPEVFPNIPSALVAALAHVAGPSKILQQAESKSYMCVPLLARGRILGAITFVSAKSKRRYSSTDLALAEDLANRAAIAIDNARLFREIQEADRRKDEFLAMLAHELRNPLAPILNALQLMHFHDTDNPTLKRLIAVVERQAQHMGKLVDDLLDVSRIMRGKIDLRKELLNLAAVVDQAVETSRPLIEARQHELSVSLPEEPVHLEADPLRLEQVLVNLLHNAAKYTEPGGRIWLVVERGEEEIVLRVRDTGIGISAEMLPRVFDLFAQADRSLDRSQGGLGIGLTLVQKLVELHGGRVSAYSAGPGQGSEFIVHLPALSETQKPRDLEVRRGEGPPVAAPPRHRVLIVDDNLDAARTLRELSQLWGHEVRTAYDGPTAIEIARTYRPEIVLLDIGLPGMDGYAVARQLRHQVHAPRMLLIALTGYGQEEDQRRSREAGFHYHFTKPINLALLQELLAAPL